MLKTLGRVRSQHQPPWHFNGGLCRCRVSGFGPDTENAGRDPHIIESVLERVERHPGDLALQQTVSAYQRGAGRGTEQAQLQARHAGQFACSQAFRVSDSDDEIPRSARCRPARQGVGGHVRRELLTRGQQAGQRVRRLKAGGDFKGKP